MWFKEYSYDETNALQDLKEIYTSHDDNYTFIALLQILRNLQWTHILKYWINYLSLN